MKTVKMVRRIRDAHYQELSDKYMGRANRVL